MNTLRPLKHIFRILRFRDRAPMAQYNNLWIHFLRRVTDLLNQRHTLIQRLPTRGANRPRRGQPHMRHQDIRTRARHAPGLVGIKHIRRRQQALRPRLPHHPHLMIIPHARLLQAASEAAVHEPDGREVLHARDAQVPQLVQQAGDGAERVARADAGQHGRLLHHGHHLGRHGEHRVVRVAVRHEPGQGAAAGHAVAARVVDDDEVAAAGFDEFGGEADA